MKLWQKRAGVAIVLLLGVSALWGIIIYRPHEIDKELQASVYRNGEVLQQTSINILGEVRKRWGSSDVQYDGDFAIAYLTDTCDPDTQAHIEWYDGAEMQSLIYSNNASYSSFNVKSKIVIDKEMNNIALELEDGMIIATSREVYDKYNELKMK